MRPLDLSPPPRPATRLAVATLFLLFLFGGSVFSQNPVKIPVVNNKVQKVSFQFSKDVFYADPAVIANELAWYSKFNGINTFEDQIRYLRMNPEAIEFTQDQKEFRNVTEEKLYKTVLKLLPKLVLESKASHFDRILKKPSNLLIVTYCEEKSPSYVGISTQKGRIVLDCATK